MSVPPLPDSSVRAAPPPLRPQLRVAAGCAYLRPPPAPPRTGEKGEQPPTRRSTTATRRLAPSPPPCAGLPPLHWARQLPVRAKGRPPLRPALREGQSDTGLAAGRKAALAALRCRSRLVFLPARWEPRWRQYRQRGPAEESEGDLGREKRKWRLRKPRLVLGSRRRADGALAIFKSTRGSYWLLGRAGFLGGLCAESGLTLSPARGGECGAPCSPGKCGWLSCGGRGCEVRHPPPFPPRVPSPPSLASAARLPSAPATAPARGGSPARGPRLRLCWFSNYTVSSERRSSAESLQAGCFFFTAVDNKQNNPGLF